MTRKNSLSRKSWWAKFTPEQRKAEMSRRVKLMWANKTEAERKQMMLDRSGVKGLNPEQISKEMSRRSKMRKNKKKLTQS